MITDIILVKDNNRDVEKFIANLTVEDRTDVVYDFVSKMCMLADKYHIDRNSLLDIVIQDIFVLKENYDLNEYTDTDSIE